jgi:hypothetical protein
MESHERAKGRDRDDASGPTCLQRSVEFLAGMQDTSQICSEETGPFVVGDGGGLLAKSLARGIDQDVDFSKTLEHTIAELPDGGSILNIGCAQKSPAAQISDLLTHALEQFHTAASGHYIRAVFRQTDGYLFAKAGCRTKHDSDTIGQIEAAWHGPLVRTDNDITRFHLLCVIIAF